MTYYIYCVLFSVGLITNVAILPSAIEKEFANQDLAITKYKEHLRGTEK